MPISLPCDNIEMQSRSSNIDNSSKSDEKSSFPSTSRHDVSETSGEQASSSHIHYDSKQSDITEEQLESENVCESEKKLLSSSTSEHDDLETSGEQASSSHTDDDSKQSDITEEQLESENVCESEKKLLSSSTSEHDDLETSGEQASSSHTDDDSKQSDITEEQLESENVCESEKKLLSSSTSEHDDLETSGEQASSSHADDDSKQSDITEEQLESENVCESEKKLLSSSTSEHDDLKTSGEQASSSHADDDSESFQSNTDMEKPSETKSSNLDNFSESDETSTIPFIPKYDVQKTSVEQASSNREDYISEPLLDIMEEQSESSNIKSLCESDETSSSLFIPKQDVQETSAEQTSSHREDYISEPLPDIMEEQSESSNIKSLCESDETSSSLFIPKQDVQETFAEQLLSNREDYVRMDMDVIKYKRMQLHMLLTNTHFLRSETLQSDITERQSESSEIENVCESEKKSLSTSIPSQDLETPVEQDSSNRDESISSKLLQSDIMEEQAESLSTGNVCDSDKKSSSPSQLTYDDLKTTTEQILTSRIDKTSRGHILADYEERIKLMERSPIKVETNLSGLSTTEPSPTEPSFAEASSMESSTESSDSDSFATIIERPTTSKSDLELKVPSSKGCIQKSESDIVLADDRSKSSATEIAQPSTSKSALELKSQLSQECTRKNDSDYKWKESQDKYQVKNMEAEESKDLTANIHDNTSDSSASEPADSQAKITSDEKFEDALESATSATEDKPQDEINQPLETFSDIVKRVPPKDKTIDKAPDEPEESSHKDERRTKCYPNSCLIILSFIILLILSVFLLSYSGLLNINQNKRTDSLKIAVVELEKMIFDQDNTVRALTKYLQQDTPLLKVVALIGDSIIDRSYTVDIMRKKLREKNKNDSLPWLPNFIVIENLRGGHSRTVINYVETFREAYNDRRFTILAVFTVEEMEDDLKRSKEMYETMKIVNDTFIKADVNVKIIPYNLLTDTDLDRYIINISKNIRQTFSQDEINNIKRYLIEDIADCQKEYDC
ncbi:uncharacterized protein [Polyergus mexicanus]|uniref:uncharacterized protein n=1 Tax=Polyergus mexicanus TaxID=615972 RepID=UPI0038B4FD0C